MKAWELHMIDRADWDCADAFVVVAETEDRARAIAAEQAGDEGAETWINSSLSACVELDASEERIVVRSFNAG